MARALGVGGIFFRSRDRKKLIEWYVKWLGVPADVQFGASFDPTDMPPHSYTVWCPFAHDTDYFDPAKHNYMFNLVVDDLDGALDQVKEGGAELVGAIEEYEYGRFGWFMDPDGNKVELWEPPTTGG